MKKSIYDTKPVIGKLECPECKKEYSVEAVLKNCSISWPVQKWLNFTCCHCQSCNPVYVNTPMVSLGLLDGAPGPCFIAFSTMMVVGLRENITPSGISIHFKENTWSFPAKR